MEILVCICSFDYHGAQGMNIRKTAIFLALASLLLVPVLQSENWPRWRGPLGTGASPDTGLPTEWGAESNIAWKAPLRGLGVSSPIVWGDRVFVTYQIGANALRPGRHPTLMRDGDPAAAGEVPLGGQRHEGGPDAKISLVVGAFDRTTGKTAWEYEFVAEGKLPETHQKNNLAASSPATDGERIYAWFGNGQIVALDMSGQPVWKRHLGQEYGGFNFSWGHSSSPLVDGVTSYTTPVVIDGPNGPELIVNCSEGVEAHDPATGKRLWYFEESNRFPIPAPLEGDGVVYLSRGYRSGPYMAIRAGGRGDISKTHVAWHVDTGAPYVSSLVYYQGLLYMGNRLGIVTCIDAETGQRVWQERLGGVYTASPVAADSKIYLVSETGETLVVRAGRSPEVLARNSLGEQVIASPAIAGSQLFVRTSRHVFAIGTGSR